MFCLFRSLIGIPVTRTPHNLVEEVLIFNLIGIMSKSDFRSEQRVIELHKHVNHGNFDNFTKSLKITHLEAWRIIFY